MLTRWSTLLDMDTIGLRELRPRLAATMRIVDDGRPVVVTNQNIPRAVLVPPDWYEAAEAALEVVAALERPSAEG